jgi:hypothetical protein
MTTKFRDHIEEYVDRLFAELNARRGQRCSNLVTGGNFIWGDDPISTQKKQAISRLRAREWFAAVGPSDAPLLPLSEHDVEDNRHAGGLTAVVAHYARSLFRLDCDVRDHPSFDDFARGLMALAVGRGLRGLENDEALKKRFPPRPLAGMTPGVYWAPPRECKETMEEYRRARLRHIATRSN